VGSNEVPLGSGCVPLEQWHAGNRGTCAMDSLPSLPLLQALMSPSLLSVWCCLFIRVCWVRSNISLLSGALQDLVQALVADIFSCVR
jgi:hypothetical protein